MRQTLLNFTLLICVISCKKFGAVATTRRSPFNAIEGNCSSTTSCVARVAWDANPTVEQVSIYSIEYGEVSRFDTHFAGYPNSRQITNQTSATLTGLKKKTYYISIRAKNAAGFSPYATEVVLNPSAIKEN